MNFEVVRPSKIDQPKVSIIIPVYNVENYIKETIESLTKQTLSPIEIILVDDGSTDNTPNIINDLLSLYPNILYAIQKNAGPGVARNNGLTLAKGEYISFVDSDDLLPEDALETMYLAAKTEDAEVVTGASLSFNSTRSWYIASHVDNGVYTPGTKSLVANKGLLYSLGPCNKMFKATLIKDLSFPTDIRVTEDHPFIIEAYLKANKIFTVDKVIYHYRNREEESNLSLSQVVRVDSVKVLRDILKSLSYSNELWNSLIPNELERLDVMGVYYHRIVTADLWPAIMSAVRSKDASIQEEAFQLIYDWLKTIDFKLYNKVPALTRITSYELVPHYSLLSQKAKELHLNWLKEWVKLSNPGTMHTLKNSNRKFDTQLCLKALQKNSIKPIQSHISKRDRRKRINKIKSRFKSAFARRVVFKFASLLPADNTIVFASNKSKGLDDSYPFIYEQIRTKRPQYKVVDDFFKKREFADLCKTYYQFGRAKYIILNDYHRQIYKMNFRKETEVIQMWHACGAFKKFGHSAVGFADSNPKQFETNAHKPYTKVVVSTNEVVPHYAEAFDIDPKNVLPLGLPRTDLFFDDETKEYVRRKFLNRFSKLKDKKIITYAPTFRGNPRDRKTFHLELDLAAMQEKLGEDYVLVLKLHPAVTNNVKIPESARDFVLNLGNENINEVLLMTDILISDYSSLLFEYTLLERPVIFFAYDYENYMKERSFFYDYHDFVPGPITSTTNEIIDLIQKDQFDLNKVKEFNKRFNEIADGRASERFVETLIK
ncbi:CDP-glycerol glycerophosphotransferase family protein [Bacillus sp. AFS088145]|uniref:bifunctional glycosyltransferase/CDP-glycerol:glycerophosphate glycerophosphotransferase n=1 Tax=Bacillus sp. AFS088145 TaxID=2033514 RepID=UPI000BF5F29F|nr:CDP-glycerol glycerophosphotransferase family protein [Bacillus sp. AFS088145]PFH87055.1 glycosyl transferase [Bacillus sp. AFS088145]